MTYREVERILQAAGFQQVRQKGSHRLYDGMVKGKRCVVTLAWHRKGDDIHPKTLASIIRQSGLPKKMFR